MNDMYLRMYIVYMLIYIVVAGIRLCHTAPRVPDRCIIPDIVISRGGVFGGCPSILLYLVCMYVFIRIIGSSSARAAGCCGNEYFLYIDVYVAGVCSSYLAEKVCDDVHCFPAEFCSKSTVVRCIQ